MFVNHICYACKAIKARVTSHDCLCVCECGIYYIHDISSRLNESGRENKREFFFTNYHTLALNKTMDIRVNHLTCTRVCVSLCACDLNGDRNGMIIWRKFYVLPENLSQCKII